MGCSSRCLPVLWRQDNRDVFAFSLSWFEHSKGVEDINYLVAYPPWFISLNLNLRNHSELSIVILRLLDFILNFRSWADKNLTTSNLNSVSFYISKSQAINGCAIVPPLLPCLDIIPIAFVRSIHFFGVKVNCGVLASTVIFRKASSLKFELCFLSHVARNSTVLRLLSQLCIK